MARYTHIKHFGSFQGLDLRSADMINPHGFATTADNCAYSPQGGLTPRRGAKVDASATGGTFLGLGTFRLDTTDITGGRKTELIVVSNGTPWRAKRSTFTIANTTGGIITVSMYYVSTQLTFVVKNAVGATILSQNLGTGFTGTPTLATLETAVDGVTGLAMTVPAGGTTPAAYMDIIPDVQVANGATGRFDFTYFEEIMSNVDGQNFYYLQNAASELGNDKFEPVAGCVINGVLYFASGPNYGTVPMPKATISKYDGQRFYRAGMKKGFESVLSDLVSSGSQTDAKGARERVGWTKNTYGYLITYKQVDKTGQIVENLTVVRSDLSSSTSSSTFDVPKVDLTPPDNTTLRDMGFNANWSTVNLEQASVLTINIVVVAGSYNLKVGDIAYFFDEIQDQWIQREVLAATASSITISATSLDSNPQSPTFDAGGPVTVNNNAIMSSNLRVGIWRLDETLQVATLAEEIAYSAPTGVHRYYYDEGGELDWGGEYVAPAWDFMTGCPQGRYVCSYNNHLIVSGNDLHATTVYFSDIDCTELFGEGTHEFDQQTRVTGIQQTAEVLCIGERNSFNVMSGSLDDFNFRVDKIGHNIGVISHFSMREVQEGIMPFLSLKGPYVLIGGRQMEPIGALTYPDGAKVSRIEPFFSKLYNQSVSHPVFHRTMAGVLASKALYVLFVPYEDAGGAYGFPNSDSVAFVFDFGRGTWFKWRSVNMAGGIADFEDTLWWTGREYDGSGPYNVTNTVHKLWQYQPETKLRYAYGDHDQPISWDYRSTWEFLGEPGQFKRFLRNRISCHETPLFTPVTFTFQTYVDFDESALSFSTDLTFSTQRDQKVKVKAEICRSGQVRFTQSVRYDPIVITGYELEAVANFRQEFRE